MRFLTSVPTSVLSGEVVQTNPFELHDWDCVVPGALKAYLNRLGNIGGAVHERHAQSTEPFSSPGWWGHRKVDRFEMSHEEHLTPGAQGFMLSNPPVACVAALRARTEIFHRVGMKTIREKSLRLTSLESLHRLATSFRGDNYYTIDPRRPL